VRRTRRSQHNVLDSEHGNTVHSAAARKKVFLSQTSA
jgi:hypothetical protein